jgi:ribose transport system ATP-binding protein
MVEIAKALRLARVALLLDEPTGALSIREVRRLFEVLRQVAALGVGIVFVTHHLSEIFEIADRVTVLRDGSVAMSAPIGTVSLSEIVQAMVGQEYSESTESEQRPLTEREPLLRDENLVVDGKLDDISLEVHKGEICGLAGLAGSGRTVLLKALYSTVRHSRGQLTLRGAPYDPTGPADAIKAGVYLLPENRRTEGLVLSHSVADNLVLSLIGRLRRGLIFDTSRARSIARTMVSALNIKPSSIDVPAESLSGGNQQKVVLGKALATQSQLLLLDEPTFGIDITTAADLRVRVRRFADEGGAAIWVSSDLREVIEVSDRILVLADGHIKQVIINRPTPVSEARLLHAIQRSGAAGESRVA